MDMEFQFGKIKQFLEIVSGDSRTTVCLHSMSQK